MARPSADHVVFDLRSRLFVCERCGSTYSMALPVSVDLLAAASESFVRTHRHCKPREAVSP